MTVVSIRCHECDTVKREEHIEMRGDGTNICDDCKGSNDLPEEVEEAKQGDTSEPEEAPEKEAEEPEEETKEQTEEDETSKFTEQDALSW